MSILYSSEIVTIKDNTFKLEVRAQNHKDQMVPTNEAFVFLMIADLFHTKYPNAPNTMEILKPEHPWRKKVSDHKYWQLFYEYKSEDIYTTTIEKLDWHQSALENYASDYTDEELNRLAKLYRNGLEKVPHPKDVLAQVEYEKGNWQTEHNENFEKCIFTVVVNDPECIAHCQVGEGIQITWDCQAPRPKKEYSRSEPKSPIREDILDKPWQEVFGNSLSIRTELGLKKNAKTIGDIVSKDREFWKTTLKMGACLHELESILSAFGYGLKE